MSLSSRLLSCNR